MVESATLTVRLPSQTKDQLALLADRTQRTSSFLAAAAIADYVARELAIVEAVHEGRSDVAAGRFTADAEVAGQAREVIKAARTKR